MSATARILAALTLVGAAGACGGSTPAASPRTAPTSADRAGTAGAQALTSEELGTRDKFAVRIVGVGVDPARAIFELSQPAFVTLISVTEAKLEAIIPVAGVPSQIVPSGMHVANFRQLDSAKYSVADRFGARAGVLEDNVGAAALGEYNRCLANARQLDAQRRQAQRPVVGRDSTGRPIYGEAAPTDPRQESERFCRMPASRNTAAAGGVQSGAKLRYLMLFASDMPTETRDIVALAITEGDPRSIAEVIGRRLFGARGAQWSGSFVSW